MIKGKYTKFYNNKEDNITLAFIAESEYKEDNNLKVCNIINKNNYSLIDNNEIIFRNKETQEGIKDINNYFDSILYCVYNFDGQIIETIIVHFNFKNSTIIFGTGKEIKIKAENKEYLFRVLKTCIKSVDGIKGFYKQVLEYAHCESPFNYSFYKVLKKLEDGSYKNK